MQARLSAVLRESHPHLTAVVQPTVRAAREWLTDMASRGDALEIALIDIGLPDGSGIEILRLVGRLAPSALRIVATVFDDDDHLMQAFAAGAQGYLLKDEPQDRLVARLRNVSRGEPAISPSLAQKILVHFSRLAEARIVNDGAVKLTARETEVLQLIGRGLRVGEAASRLGLSEHTVASHLKSIYAKLGISGRAEATLEAVRRKLI